MAPSSLDKALHLHRSGRLKEAERLYLQVLKASPAHEDARRLLAVLKHQSGRSSEALADLDRLLASRPLFPEALANRGVVLAALGRADEAEAAFRQALELVPGFPDAVLQLARLLLAQERLDEVGRLLARAPQDWPVEKAALAHKLGAFDQAEAILRRALEARPDDAKLLEALVPVLTALGRHQEAIGTARAALALAPSQPALRHNLALALLGSGHLEEGWAEYAHRWDSPHFPSHQRPLKGPRWDGKADISSRSILVWREQGVGDEISFASALPDLIERAGRVVVECSSKLVPLFARSFPRALVRAEERGQVEGALETDFQMPIGDLFSIFRPRLERFTGQAYLSADPAKVSAWRERLAELGPEPKIGIAWRSTLDTPGRRKYYPGRLEALDPLLGQPGKTFVVLQPGVHPQELEEARQRTGARIVQFQGLDLYDDLEETAALMTALDRIVSNGAVTAMLAGALGVPTGVLLLKHSQWATLGTGGIPWLSCVKPFFRSWNEDWASAVNEAVLWLGGDSAVQTPVRALPSCVQTSGADSLLDQATASHLAGRKNEAENLYRSALTRDPDCVEALVNLAALFDESLRSFDAVKLLEHARKLRPGEPAIPCNLGRALVRLDQLEEAVPVLQDALRLEPNNAGIVNDLGNVLRLLGRLDEAQALLKRALALMPGMGEARFNLGRTLREMNCCEEALRELKAIPNPDNATLWEIGAAQLQMGDLALGWRGIDYRPDGLAGRPLPDCRGKTVLVRAEQGIGDMLYYLSALPDLLAVASRVILAVPPKLHPLLARTWPGLTLAGDKEPPPAADIVLPLGSLFHLFRPSLESFASAKPYLLADPNKVRQWQIRLDRLGPGFKLGVAWRSTLITRARARIFPGTKDRIGQLLELPNLVPVSLQARATSEELKGLVHFADLDLFDDLDEAAALIMALDGVAANDSAIGILAAALGAPTALLMRAGLDWVRLGTQGIPWLPAAKLFDCAWNEPWEAAAERAARWIRTLPSRSSA